MNNTYTLNQNPIPQVPMTTGEKHRLLNMLIILLSIGAIIVLLYLWTTGGAKPAPIVINSQDAIRNEVASLLMNSSVQVTQQDITSVTTQLKASKVVVTDSQKQSVANALREQ